MFQLRKKILGLDIGNRALKGVSLSKRGTELVLEDYFYIDLKESLDDGAVDPDFTSFLRAVVDGRNLRDRPVATALTDRELQIANFSIPELPEREIKAVVLNKLEAQLGKSADSLAVDYVVVSGGTAENGGAARAPSELYAYYTRLESVRERIALLEEAKLRPFSIECSMHATLEAARFNGYIPEDGSCLLVDVGDSHTSLGLVSRGELVLLNVIPAGAGAINQSLMEQFELSFQDSELRKLACPLDKDEGSVADEKTKLIEHGYFQIILGIHDTANYLKAARKSQAIGSLILTGGGLLKTGAAQLIQESLNLPVVVMDPLRKIQIYSDSAGQSREDLPQIGPMLQVAVGLALRGVA